MNMSRQSETFTGADLVLVIPTKGRPGKLGELLDSIAGQSVICGKVIVVDGADSAGDIASGFKTALPIEYYRCPLSGQIRQRNMGLAKLRPDNKLIGFLDDDLVLEPEAFEEIIKLWNSVEPETAGIGFNMVNMPRRRYSRVKGFFFLDHPHMGRVLKSGMNTGINNVTEDIRTQWLGGGYTVWRREILAACPQAVLNTRWAVGEDLRYSYPIGKKYPLYVCSRARVHHHHVYDQAAEADVARYRGRKIAAASVFFAVSNEELSLISCLWMLLGLSLGRFFQSLFTRDLHSLKEALGQMEGLLFSVKQALRSGNNRSMLEDG